MKLKPEHLAVIGAASKDATRLILSGLRVHSDMVAATNSYALVVMERAVDDEDGNFEAILPPAFVKAITPEAKRSGSIELSQNGDGKIEAKSLALADMETTWRTTAIEGQYPRWQQYDPKARGQERVVSVRLNAKLLRDLMATLVEAGATDGVYMEVYTPTEDHRHPPLMFVRADGENPDMLAMIMPMDGDSAHESAWLKRVRAPVDTKGEEESDG